MRNVARVLVVLVWLYAVGTASSVRAVHTGEGGTEGCYWIGDEWVCCDPEEEECPPPGCVFINGYWHCPD